MTKVIYVPLDERACNYYFPQQLAAMTEGIEMLVPPYEDMGFLKKPADCNKIWDWIFENIPECDYAIFSVDTLVYGNIINSRTHYKTCEECQGILENFRGLKKINPNIKIHAFNLAARVAAYSDAHEDPDYWGICGREIWRYTYLCDKINRGHAGEEEKKEAKKLEKEIPKQYLDDFMQRRKVNRFVNLYCVDLAKDGIFDVLTIPKDDTAEYGFAAMDQAAIAKKVREERLMDRVLVYPGADEVGSVIFARVFNLIKGYVPKIYVRYSSTLGSQIIPSYEDRPLGESIKAQIFSIGGVYEDNAERSDCMLAVNSPGKYMIESMYQDEKDLTFTSHINMHEFLRYIHYYCDTFKKAVGIAEVSVCNGCENEFMDYALISGALNRVQAVGGWNTSQNTIGVVLAQTVISSYYNRFENCLDKYKLSEEFKMRSIVCDWLFQANVLREFLKETENKIDPFALEKHYDEAKNYVLKRLNRLIDLKFGGKYKGSDIKIDELFFNWDGVFYIRAHVTLNGIQYIL